jgi:predicted secreted protein
MFHESRAAHVALAVFFSLAVGAAFAASPLSVELSSEASRPAANDLMQATLSAEVSGSTPGELSQRINQTVANALALAKSYPTVKVQSGGTNTYPIYAENGSIKSWSMRSNILLESGDVPALSELLGKLQASLAVSSLRLLPSPETRRKAEDAAILEAVALFEARAKLLADARGRSYRIETLSIDSGRRAVPMSLAVRAAPMPVESGESMISVSVSGKVEIE